jgi:hypothetical protein
MLRCGKAFIAQDERVAIKGLFQFYLVNAM